MIPVLKPNFPQDTREIIYKDLDVAFQSGWIGQGGKVKELEERWASYTGSKYAVAVNSCTSALDVAVRLVDLPKEVTVSAFTFISSALCALNAGHTVKFVDIDPKSHCTDKADIQVMYAGNQHGEGMIYDMAHSGGAKHKGVVSCWSFHAVKNLPAGDGGMITMNDKTLYHRAKALAWCGINKSTFDRSGKKYAWDYSIEEKGLKAHMNDITAIIALAQLNILSAGNAYREYLASLYNRYLPEFIERPFRSTTWHLYTIEVDKRDALYEYLAENGIGCGVHYKPLYKYPIFEDQETLPNTERSFERIISLPMHMEVTEKDVKTICNHIKYFYGSV